MGPAQIERADRWFQRHGEPAVLFGRVIPVVRAFVSLPAGIARMPFGRFTVYSLIGAVPWVVGARARRASARQRLEERPQGLRVRRLRGRSRWWWSAIVYAVVRRRRERRAPGDRCGGLSGALPLRHAVALGLLQGPTELLPSPPRPTRRCCRGSPAGATRSSTASCASRFEVALHAGARRRRWRSTCARELRRATHAGWTPRRAAALALVAAARRRSPGWPCGAADRARTSAARARSPRACRGRARRWRSPTRAPGGAASARFAEAGARRRAGARARPGARAGARGLAQRRDARRPRARGASPARTRARLSWTAALPVIARARALLRGRRGCARRGVPGGGRARGDRRRGAAAAFCSTLASARVAAARRATASMRCWPVRALPLPARRLRRPARGCAAAAVAR